MLAFPSHSVKTFRARGQLHSIVLDERTQLRVKGVHHQKDVQQ